ncbi:MAG: PhzF family phenazine biosynthesis protein, partial [Alphaproteobacteria bacterium]
GIDEDPATGSAATALAGYLAPLEPGETGTVHWSVAQGVEMGRPSRIDIEAELSENVVSAIRISGSSVLVSRGEIEIPKIV